MGRQELEQRSGPVGLASSERNDGMASLLRKARGEKWRGGGLPRQRVPGKEENHSMVKLISSTGREVMRMSSIPKVATVASPIQAGKEEVITRN